MSSTDTCLAWVFLIIAIVGIIGTIVYSKKKKQEEENKKLNPIQAKSPQPLSNTIKSNPNTPVNTEQPVFSLDGAQDLLQVYEDRVEIVPRGLLGFMNKGVRGVKEIPYYSIVAVQFKEPGITNGYIQFTIPGGNESKGGIMDAVKDENTFIFAGPENNAKALQIKQFVNNKVKAIRMPQAVPQPQNLSDEIQKLANLKAQGLITEEEYQSAKSKLLK
jgi:hypothetical protein